MAEQNTIPAIRLRLPCGTESEFHTRFARQLSSSFFVAQDITVDAGARVRVHVALGETELSLRGQGTAKPVTKNGRKGVAITLTELDKDGLQIELATTRKDPPSVRTSPALIRRSELARRAADSESNAASPAPSDATGHDDFGDSLPTIESQVPAAVAAQLKNRPPTATGVGTETNTVANVASDSEPRPGTLPSPPNSPHSSRMSKRVTAERPALQSAAVQSELSLQRPPATNGSGLAYGAPAAATPAQRSQKGLFIVAGLMVAGLAAAGAVFLTRADNRPSATTAEAATPTQTPKSDTKLAPTRSDADTVAALLLRANERVSSGELTGPDSALEHLLAAKRIAPDSEDVKRHLGSLADTFEKLAEAAERSGNLAEAAAHLQAAINSEPSRRAVVDRLHDIEERVRARQRSEN